MSDVALTIRRAKRAGDTKIDLSSKQISSLPSQLFTLNLEVLILSNNDIVILDDRISKLKALKILDISNNKIQFLPECLSDLPQLMSLNLTNNPLKSPFDIMLLKENQEVPYLSSALAKCFGKTTSVKSPDFVNKLVSAESQLNLQKSMIMTLQKQLNQKSLCKVIRRESGISIQGDTILQVKQQSLKLDKQIGMGGFSVIYKAQYFGTDVCVKKVFDPNISQELLDQVSNQINMLAKFRHPNIVSLLGICSNLKNLCIVTQLFQKGSLFELIHKKAFQFSLQDKLSILRQTAVALLYLHSHGVSHRDIKSHNIMLCDNNRIKLIDFGLCRKFEQLNRGPMQFSGTPVYMAPQLFSKKAYNESVDIFAYGTLMWEILTNSVPYDGLDPQDIKQKVLKDSSLPSKGKAEGNLLRLLNRCRSANSGQRPSFVEIIKTLNN